MHAQVIEYSLYNFHDSAYELNALKFTFKTGIAQYKNEWQNLR